MTMTSESGVATDDAYDHTDRSSAIEAVKRALDILVLDARFNIGHIEVVQSQTLNLQRYTDARIAEAIEYLVKTGYGGICSGRANTGYKVLAGPSAKGRPTVTIRVITIPN